MLLQEVIWKLTDATQPEVLTAVAVTGAMVVGWWLALRIMTWVRTI